MDAPRPPGRPTTTTGRLMRLGFADVARTLGLLDELAAKGIDLTASNPAGGEANFPPAAESTHLPGSTHRPGAAPTDQSALEAFGQAADPDQALLAIIRAAEADPARVSATLTDQRAWRRMVSLLGTSAAFGDHLVHHPAHMAVFSEPNYLGGQPDQVRAALLSAVGADPTSPTPVASSGGEATIDGLRVAYRRQLLAIAAQDCAAESPEAIFPLVGAALADLADATLEAALAIARAETPGWECTRLAVIGMGKCGGRELNYVSDVDVIYVAEPVEGADEQTALEIATALAAALQRVCTVATDEPALWQVDPNLRPEGKDGPLVRTLASHRAYYDRWAKTWEFQALLKARAVAGDQELGQAYVEMTRPMVWACVEREGFVEAAQAMRRRVEEHVPRADAERQIKLGRGGLRDVEFTVQLLQLVHGRLDEAIHSGTTLTALEQLRSGGYVGREAAARLGQCYRFARVLEHRVQLARLRRTHLLPTSQPDLRRLARAVRLTPGLPETLLARWDATRREVRGLHEEMFYRPLLPETARLSADEAVLAPAAATRRLTALGYRDPAGAMRHIAALTEGVSRRAALQRQLLPVMLGWFAQGADPDAGLLSFRRLSEELGSTPWYLRMLRDSAGAAHHLSQVLATSRYVAEGLLRAPESVLWFGRDEDLEPRTRAQIDAELAAVVVRRPDPLQAAQAIRAVRRRELTRLGAARIIGLLDDEVLGQAISAVTEATISAALNVVTQAVAGQSDSGPGDQSPERADPALVPSLVAAGQPSPGQVRPPGQPRLPTRFAIIAMGSLGGAEMSLTSDADVLFVHDPLPDADDVACQVTAVAVATRLRALLGDLGPEPPLDLDPDLRPEGRNGPLVRSLAAYGEYYDRWALGWERQALLRARPIAGDVDLGQRFMAQIDPVRYLPGGIGGEDLTELRRLKARVESERLPRGVEKARHLKLGPGGLLDIQWVAQLFQLRRAGQLPELRVTGTIEALEAAVSAGLADADEVSRLVVAWRHVLAYRNANVLWTGRTGQAADVVPHDSTAVAGVSRILGYGPGEVTRLADDHLRITRQARTVFQHLMYD